MSMKKEVLRKLPRHKMGASEKACQLKQKWEFGALPPFSRILEHRGEHWVSPNICDGSSRNFIYILKDRMTLVA